MPPVLQIGATVDVQEVRAGMDAGVEAVKASTSKMALNFDELASISQRSFARISESTKEAAETVSAEWVRAAQSSAVYTKAQVDVRAAMDLVKKSAGEDAAAIALLAAAQERAATASLQAAEAAKLAASAETKVAAESEVAATGIGAAFRRTYASVLESTLGMRKALSEVGVKMAETAEVAEVEAGVMKGAFAGLGSLLGAGIVVGFFAHFLDEAAKVEVELGHLRTQTGLSIQTLAGLKATTQQLGMEFQPLETGLIRLERAQTLAVEGGKQQIAAFKRIGLEVRDIKDSDPDTLFFQVAKAMANAKTEQDALTSAVTLFGKGGAANVPLFKEMGNELQNYVTQAGKASGITNESVEAAAKWTKETAILSQQFQAMLIPILTFLVDDVIPPLRGAMNSVSVVFSVASIEIRHAADEFVIFAKGISDFTIASRSFNLSGMKSAVTDTIASLKGDHVKMMGELTDLAKDEVKKLNEIWGEQKVPQISAPSEDGPSGGGKKPPKDTRLQDWKAELQAKKDAEDAFHTLSLSDEAAFWQSKLELARGTPKLFAEVTHQISDAERKEKQDDLKETADSVRNRVAAEKSGSSERLIIIRDFLAQMRAMHAEAMPEYKQFSRMEVEETRANEEQKKRIALDAEMAKVAASKSGSAEHVRVLTEALEVAKRLYKEDSAEYQKVLKDKNKAEADFAQKTKEAQSIELEADKNHQVALLNDEKQRITTAAQLGQISEQQKLGMLRAVENQEYQIALDGLQRRLALMNLDPVEQARINAQIVALEDAHNHRLLQIDSQSLQARTRLYQQFAQTMKSGLDNAIAGMIQGTQTLSKSFQQILTAMVTSLVQHLAQMAARWVLQHTIMGTVSRLFHLHNQVTAIASESAITAAHATGVAARTAIDTTALATKNVALIASNVAAITSEAGLAGAAGFASAMAALPFPVNVAVAPGVMASAIAQTMSNIALGTASKGALLGQDALVLAHKNEMILPSHLSAGVQSMISSGSPSSSGGGGDTHFHHHSGPISALDSSGVAGILENNKRELAKQFRRLAKSGHLKLRHAF